MGQLILRESANLLVKATVSDTLKIRLALLLAVCTVLFGCTTVQKPKAEAVPSPVVPKDQPQQASNLPPPELNTVQEAVKRVFKDSALIDTSRKPAFISGDFNGDLSQDIAVVLKPAPEKLSELNEEFANWMVRDPFATSESRVPRLRVAADDVLLGVIHGYGPNGWQDPQATQTYLLKNAVGSGMEAHHAKDVVAANEGKKQPHLNGDVIGQVIAGTPGYLYYGGASYSWYDPKTFRGDPEPGMFHGVRQRVKK